MTSSGGVPGLDAWMRAFRDAMPGGSSSAPFGTGGWSGWPGMNSAMGTAQMPGMGAAFAGMSPPAAGPFTGMFEQMTNMAHGQWQQFASQMGAGVAGMDDAPENWRRFIEAMAPTMLANFTDNSALRDALSTPQVGLMREHAERWQKAMLAQLDYQQASQVFSARLAEIFKLAMGYFQQRLAERGTDDQELSMRAVFDEWVAAGEQAWAERASDEAFVSALGQYTNAQLRVRAAMIDQVNRWAESAGLPTRTEVESDHRRIAMLERELRRLRRDLDTLRESAGGASPAEKAEAPRTDAAGTPQKSARKPAARKVAGTSAASRKTASSVSKPATKSARKTAAKKAGGSRRAASSSRSVPKVEAPRAIGRKAAASASDTTGRGGK